MKSIFKGKIRNGNFGNISNEEFEILLDEKYGYAKLDHFPEIDYKSSSYRKLVNNSTEADEYFKMHDIEQSGYFYYISKFLSRNSIVADCGCGGGSLLDLIKGMVSKTIAIEPYLGYHESLINRGHEVYESVESAEQNSKAKPNIALSMQVIEHTSNPLVYLKNIYDLLIPDSKLILFTPNLNDIMLKLHFNSYAPFFFRTVHNYYFTADSLVKLGKDAGFNSSEVIYYQDFGLDNTFYWLKESSPNKNRRIDGVDDNANKMWKNYLEMTGQSYNVGIILSK
jgi:2-polyprenyl-3-methyl-5-hydroxy-6-metoxy-1,4-benzoquinol methylase